MIGNTHTARREIVEVNFMATYEKIHFSVVSAFFIGRCYKNTNWIVYPEISHRCEIFFPALPGCEIVQ